MPDTILVPIRHRVYRALVNHRAGFELIKPRFYEGWTQHWTRTATSPLALFKGAIHA